jgi:hypothetical protein
MEDTSKIRRIESKQDTRPDDPMDIDSINRKYKGINNQKQRSDYKGKHPYNKEEFLYAIQLSILKRTVNIIFLIKGVNIINF